MYQGEDEPGSTVRQALRQAPALGERTGMYQGEDEPGSTVRQALRQAPAGLSVHICMSTFSNNQNTINRN